MTTSRISRSAVAVFVPALLGATLLLALPATAGEAAATERAAWLLERMQHSPDPGSGTFFQQDQFGMNAELEPEVAIPSVEHSPLLLLASAVLPGSGEILMGHWKRGVPLVALDAYCWYKVKDEGDQGEELEDEYYEFADAHWTEDNLVAGYNPASLDIQRGGVGLDYFSLDEGFSSITNTSELDRLTLWVSKEDDRREYYENLGKWDQFVFGWDDFRNPNNPPDGILYTPDMTLSDLRQPWTSVNREKYRDLREESNDHFKRQDRYMYVNIGLRLFSVMQVAYLQGWLGGRDGFEVSGHEVQIFAEPDRSGRGKLLAQVSF